MPNRYEKHGMTGTGVCNAWNWMNRRCVDKNHPKSHNYAGKGIKVCDEWRSSSAFIRWALSNGYKDGLTLDRKNSDKDYCPENCRWATKTTQSRNRKKTKGTTSKFIGVSFRKSKNSWSSEVTVKNKRVFRKSFKTETEAAVARDNYIIINNLKDYTMNF